MKPAIVRRASASERPIGRGGEEALALEAGAAYEVVPGESSAIAVPALAVAARAHVKSLAEFPITDRGLSFVLSGHAGSAFGATVDSLAPDHAESGPVQ